MPANVSAVSLTCRDKLMSTQEKTLCTRQNKCSCSGYKMYYLRVGLRQYKYVPE